MSRNIYSELRESIEVGFFDANYSGEYNEQFVPQLVVNDAKNAKKVVDQLERELKTADAFWFSVAFMTTSGVAILKQQLQRLSEKGVKGKILVSQYQNFTQPQALREILKFSNIELRMATTGNYHAKGYLFDNPGSYTLIVGSSNFTAQALTQNQEWNLKVVATKEAKIASAALHEFSATFEQATMVTPEFINAYEQIYEQSKISWRALNQPLEVIQNLQPNSMQIQALRGINRLYDAGEQRALLVSATGTGKTYLSAFHVHEKRPKTFLFLVHRENIARAAMESYRRVLGDTISLGMYTGNEKTSADYLFATIQTISVDDNLTRFKPTHFDYIVIDETHRAGAKSYQKIFDYFQPKFVLGMSATPERMDGFDIFSQFDHNLAYEIRLHQALDQGMLTPFHYYGVSELEINGEQIEEKSKFNRLTVDERIDHVYEKMAFYNCDDGEVRGLIFCSKNKESDEISRKLNQRGLRTLAISSETSEMNRQEAIRRLELLHHDENKLDYLLTVDIFNEGIDIPSVNQVVMLRPTQSANIFVQQLGRGLRKTATKEYLTVIDFIGNYKNNYLVPIALFGDKSYNREQLRNLIVQGTTKMPSSCSVNFDEIAKKQIFAAIDNTNLQQKSALKDDYKMMKYKLGRQPMMMDFVRFGSRDPYQYVNDAKSYYHFVQSLAKDETPLLDEKTEKLLIGLQGEVLNAKRISEVILFKLLLSQGQTSRSEIAEVLEKTYGILLSQLDWESCLINSNMLFHTVEKERNGEKITYAEKYNLKITERNGDSIKQARDLKIALENKYFQIYLDDAIEYAEYRYKQTFESSRYRDGFLISEKYTKKDIFRILNWLKNFPLQSGYINIPENYKITPEQLNCPIFVTYHKDGDISKTTQYKDLFVNESILEWYSTSNRYLESSDIDPIIKSTETNLRIPLFIQKIKPKKNAKNADKGYYYLGDVTPIPLSQQQCEEHGKPIVKLHFKLNDPVEEKLFEYLITQ